MSLSPCFHGNADEGSCILRRLSSSLPAAEVREEEHNTGREDSNGRKAEDQLEGVEGLGFVRIQCNSSLRGHVLPSSS